MHLRSDFSLYLARVPVITPFYLELSLPSYAFDEALSSDHLIQGRPATITVKNGDAFVGIFSGSSFETTETCWLLKMVKRNAAGSDRLTNGVDAGSGYVGSGPEHAMYFDLKDVVDLAVDGVTFGDHPSKGPNGRFNLLNGIVRARAHCRRRIVGVDLSNRFGHLGQSRRSRTDAATLATVDRA